MAKPKKPAAPKIGIDSVNKSYTGVVTAAVVGVVLVLIAAAVLIAKPWQKTEDLKDAALVQYQSVGITGDPLPQFKSADNDTAINSVGPSLSGKSFDGTPVEIRPSDKSKVLIFIAHWCPHCQAEVPKLSKWIADNKAAYPNVEFYAIATATNPASVNYPPSAWLKKEDWPTQVMADDNSFSAAKNYGLSSYPYMVALHKDMKVSTRQSGELGTDVFETTVVKPIANG